MRKTLVIAAALVFVAGASYGFIVPIVKIASAQGVRVLDTLPSLYLLAFAASAIYTLVRRVPLESPKQLLKFASLGIFTAGCSLCYYHSLTLLPSAVSLTLLFQFVWVGVIIETVVDRRLPSRSTIIAVVIVLVGTVFAAGVLDASFASLDPLGLVLGLGSALFYALFLFTSGRVGVQSPVALRTTMLCLGGFITTLVFNPGYFASSFLLAETWPYATVLAALGVLVPVSLIAYASPKLSTGVTNIMASSELPAGIICAWAILGETPSVLTLIGVAIVLAGIVYNQLPNLRGSGDARKSLQ